MNGNNPLRAYKETQIKTASPGKLIIMLYDGAIKHCKLAHENLEKGFKFNDKACQSLTKAQDIISELMVSLDFEKGGDIAKNLFSLYVYMNRRLLDSNLQKDAEPVKEVQNMLSELRGAWIQIIDQRPAGMGQPPRTGGINIAG